MTDDYDQMTPYERAQWRLEMANLSRRLTKNVTDRMIRDADEEWELAEANLRKFEKSPGIPKDARERDDLDEMLDEVNADPDTRAAYEDALRRDEP